MGGYSDIGKKTPQKWWSSILAIQENKVLCKNHKVPFKKEKKIVKKNKQFLLLTNLAKRLIGLQVIWFIFHPWSLKKKCHISKQPTKPSQSLFFLALALIRYSVFVFFVCLFCSKWQKWQAAKCVLALKTTNYISMTIAEYGGGVSSVSKEGITIHNNLIQKQYND